MNLDVAANDLCLDPHVGCVETAHPAAQLDVNPEQRSVRQPMMSVLIVEMVLMSYP